MNWNEIEGRWLQVRGQLKSKWGKLTDDDIAKCEGKRDRLIGTIQTRYGVAQEEAAKQVDDWTSRLEMPGRGDAARREPPPAKGPQF